MSALGETLRLLEAVVGERHLLTATEATSEYAVEGQRPVAVAFPRSAEEVAAALRTASEGRLSALLRGGGTHLHLGEPCRPIGVVVSLARLSGVVEYNPEDVTITVQAGLTLGDLQRTAGEQGQMLPLDPPGPDTATLGGIAAANLAGPMRMRYGTPRDLVLGMRVALATGEVIKTGGRTVKNVAGYDLGKLFIGSLGTVGAICEVTARLTPRPEARATLAGSLPAARAAEVATWLVRSPLEPMACQLINQAAAERVRGRLPVDVREGEQVLVVRLAGAAEGLVRQEREVCARVGDCARVEGEEEEALWRGVRELAYPAPGAVLARAAVPVSRSAEVMGLVSSELRWSGAAQAGDGIVYAFPPGEEALDEVTRKLRALRAAAEGRGGHVVLESGPVEVKRQFPVWGEVGNLDLMGELRRAYDPTGALGCGRLLGGP